MDAGSLAPETEHYLLLDDASDKIVFALKLVEDEKKKKHLPGETAFLSNVENQLKGAEEILAGELKRLGKPTKCPKCGSNNLVAGLNGFDCQVCHWEHEY